MSRASQGRRTLASIAQGQTKAWSEAIELLHRGRTEPSKEHILHLIKQCGHERALTEGIRLAEYIHRSPFKSDRYVLNFLLDMHGKCGRIEDATLLFETIPQRNEFTWTLMIKAYAQNGHLQQAIHLFRKLLLDGTDPSDYVCSILLGACCTLESISIGRAVSIVIRDRGYMSDVFVGAGLIHMYNKCGCLDEARLAFDGMCNRDRYVYTAMICGYAQYGHFVEAITLFRVMDQEGIRGDEVTLVSVIGAYETLGDPGECRVIYECAEETGLASTSCLVQTALLNMLSRTGRALDALQVFDKIAHRDKVAWSSVIAACAKHGYGEKALYLFHRMEHEGVKPDIIVLSSLLDACSSVEALGEGTKIHERIVAGGYEQDRVLKAAILNMYARCGSALNAKKVFEQSPADAISWNVLIGACAKASMEEEALATYVNMQLEGVTPTLVTFIIVLAACSHGGFVDEGKLHFHSILEDYSMEPDVDCYCCMVDLLARTGELEDGENLMRNMPYEPDEAGWTCLLSACGSHGDLDRAARIAVHAVRVCSKISANYVLFSNMFTRDDEEDNDEFLDINRFC